MATANFLSAVNMATYPIWYGYTTGATSSAYTISDGYRTAIYSGNFAYDANNIYGTLTGFTEYRGNSVATIVSGFAVDATAAATLINAGQIQTLLAGVLGGPDFINGSSGSDVLLGLSGNDVFRGNGGNDTIDGGAGIDTVVFSGASSQYTVNLLGGGTAQVADKTFGRDGTDTLNNVERLYFTDKVIALDTDGHAGQAYRLYQAALARTPDTPGLSWHVRSLDQGTSLHDDAANFLASPEFGARYGANLSDQAFVTALYQNVLKRGPDAAGLSYWTSHLADQSFDRATVLVGFSESPENKAVVGVQIANGITLDGLA